MRPSFSARSEAAPLALVLALAASAASAQSTEPTPPFPVQQVELAPQPELFAHGKAALYHGEVSEQGHGFALAGLSMMQPIGVTVLADPDEPVTLTIGKEWALADRTASTDAAGHTTELFRTDDLVQLRVHAPGAAAPRRYDLVIWVGDERTDYPDMPSSVDFGRPEEAAKPPGPASAPTPAPEATPTPAPVAAPPTSPSPPSANSLHLVLWVIAGLLAALVAIAGVAVFRRRKP